jgi:hypothetical protein
MKKKFTISVALLFITAMSFAQSVSTRIARDYSYTDNSTKNNETGLDRLKMTEPGNSVTYSTPVKAEKVSTSKTEIVIFPDMAHWNQKITISNLTEPSDIRIFDYAGRVIKKLSSTGNSVEIDKLQKGNYFVKIIGMQTGSSSVKKLSVIY